MRLTLINKFHNTQAKVNLKQKQLSESQMKRANRKLCGVDGCCCPLCNEIEDVDGNEIEWDYDVDAKKDDNGIWQQYSTIIIKGEIK